MYLSNFLTQHLKYSYQTVECSTVCKMCGKALKIGVNQKDIIKKATFNDYQYLTHKSDFLCTECSALISDIQLPRDDKKRRLRSFSFIASEQDFKVLKREQLWNCLLNPPEPPFVFCVTYSNKKHIAFKSQIQFEQQSYSVFTDKGEVKIDLRDLGKLLRIIAEWYTILPDRVETKQQPTWFTKGEILNRGRNYKNIIAYGLQKYQEENQFLKQYRNTALLTFLVFALNKKINSNLKVSKIGQFEF